MKEDKLFQIAEEIIKLSDMTTDVIIISNNYLFQRFANSFIHQPTYEENYLIGIRIRDGNKLSLVWTNSTNKENLSYLLKKAKSFLIEDEHITPLKKKEIPSFNFAYDEFDLNADEGARIIEEVIKIGKNYKAFGNFYKGFQHILMLSSDGFEGYNKTSICHITVNYINGTSAWSQYSSYKISDILENYKLIAEDCLYKANLNKNLSEIEPGQYTVIFSSLALYDILEIINYFAFSSKNYYDNLSPFRDKLNQKIFSEKINLYEKPLNIFPIGFDFEGNIKQNFPVIENGILRNIALNNKYSNLLNLQNNACANIPFSEHAIFSHLYLKGGDKPLEKIIEETEKGILVNRVWYVNLVEMQSLTLTGMTRDGLYFIENGKIKYGLKNMRFTQSFIEAFNNIEEISNSERIIVNSNFYEFFPRGFILPDVKISKFHFISKTEF